MRPSRHDMAVAHRNTQQLWLPTEDRHRSSQLKFQYLGKRYSLGSMPNWGATIHGCLLKEKDHVSLEGDLQ